MLKLIGWQDNFDVHLSQSQINIDYDFNWDGS